MNKKAIIVVICTAILTTAILVSGYFIIYNKRTTMDKSHVFVSDSTTRDSEFDEWILDEVNWVPTFLIIKNKKEIGYIRGTINEPDFTSELGTIAINPNQDRPLPNLSITNIEGKTMNLNDIFYDDEIYILELHWIDCPDCIEQDEKFTEQIYARYSTSHIYRYYMNSDKQKVIDKYTKGE